MLRALSCGSVLLLLAGCASAPKPKMMQAPIQHHQAVAPAPVVVTPSPKQTFKQRWLHKFFRERVAK